MKVAGLRPTSLFDGEGINFVIFTQGCKHHCKHCQNECTWDFNGGTEMTTKELKQKIEPYIGFIDGVTFSGGDPVYQMKEVNDIAKWAKRKGLNTTLYTGFLMEELVKNKVSLTNIDCVIDGQYIDEEKTTELPFRGSGNQKMYVKVNGKFVTI